MKKEGKKKKRSKEKGGREVRSGGAGNGNVNIHF